MAKARNKVIAGDYTGAGVFVDRLGYVSVSSPTEADIINKRNVEEYELITDEKIKSKSSALLRGAAGAALLGPAGLLAGLTAKSNEIKTVAIFWKSGKRSLIEVDAPTYKAILKAMF